MLLIWEASLDLAYIYGNVILQEQTFFRGDWDLFSIDDLIISI